MISWNKKTDGSYALIVGDSLLSSSGTDTTTYSDITSVMPSGDVLKLLRGKPDGSYAIMGGNDGCFSYTMGQTLHDPDPNTSQFRG